MTLTDPTSGAGYAFGEILPSADMTTIATQLPRALDGNLGGTYTPTAPIDLAGDFGFGDVSVSGTLQFRAGAILNLNMGAQLGLSVGAISDTDNQTLTPTAGIIQRLAVGPGDLAHQMVAPGNQGHVVILTRDGSGAGAIEINRNGSFAGGANLIVTFGANNWGGALLYDDGTNWRLGLYGGADITPGASA